MLAPGCQPADTEISEHHEDVCGEPGPRRLLDLPLTASGWVVGQVGDRIVATVADAAGQETSHAVGPCGEDPVELALSGSVATRGDWLFTHQASTGDIDYHDVHTGEHHRVLTDVHPLDVQTPHGMLALGRNGGPLLLHPDPSDPAAEPITLLSSTMDLGASFAGPVEELYSDGTHTFAIDPAGSLLRIELATGAQELLVEDVVGFRVVDDGAQIVYLPRDAGEPFLRELATGDEIGLGPDAVVSLGDPYLHVREAHDWLSVGLGVLVHLRRHEVLAEKGSTYAHPAEDGRAIVARPRDLPPSGMLGVLAPLDLWLLDDDGTFELLAESTCIDFSGSSIEVFHPNGVALDEECRSDTSLGDPEDVVLYPIDGEPSVVGRSFGDAWLMSGHVLSVDFEARLLIDSAETEPSVVAEGVVAVAAPTEGGDLYYLVEGRGLYHAILGL